MYVIEQIDSVVVPLNLQPDIHIEIYSLSHASFPIKVVQGKQRQ